MPFVVFRRNLLVRDMASALLVMLTFFRTV